MIMNLVFINISTVLISIFSFLVLKVCRQTVVVISGGKITTLISIFTFFQMNDIVYDSLNVNFLPIDDNKKFSIH